MTSRPTAAEGGRLRLPLAVEQRQLLPAGRAHQLRPVLFARAACTCHRLAYTLKVCIVYRIVALAELNCVTFSEFRGALAVGQRINYIISAALAEFRGPLAAGKPNYLPASDPARWGTFTTFLHGLVTELTELYAPDTFWFDCSNSPPGTDTHLEAVLHTMREANPEVRHAMGSGRTVGGT